MSSVAFLTTPVADLIGGGVRFAAPADDARIACPDELSRRRLAQDGIETQGSPPSGAPPPHQLRGAECNATAAFAVERAPKLPGWGLVLGAYPEQFRAQHAIDLAKPGLGLSAPTVLSGLQSGGRCRLPLAPKPRVLLREAYPT